MHCMQYWTTATQARKIDTRDYVTLLDTRYRPSWCCDERRRKQNKTCSKSAIAKSKFEVCIKKLETNLNKQNEFLSESVPSKVLKLV